MKLAALLLLVPAAAHANTYDIHLGDDLYGTLQTLAPGDIVTIHFGSYTAPGPVQLVLAGQATNQIIIRGAPGEMMPVLIGSATQPTLSISGTYFQLLGLEFTSGSDGLQLGTTSNAIIDGCVLNALGDAGIACSDCSHVTLTNTEILDTGHAGAGAAVSFSGHDSIIAHDFIHDTGGTRGDGIAIAAGSYANEIRDNVLVRTKGSGITLDVGAIGQLVNIVDGNAVLHAGGDGILFVGQATVRNNIAIASTANGIESAPIASAMPHDLTVIHNTVVGAATCFAASGWATTTNQIVANNALYCGGTTAIELLGGAPAATLSRNIGLGAFTLPAGFRLGADLATDLGRMTDDDVYPPTGSSLIDVADPAYTDSVDFNGFTRDVRPDVGAYEHLTDENPGWIVGEGFKQFLPQPIDQEVFFPSGPPDDGGGGFGFFDAGFTNQPSGGCGCRSSDPGGATLFALLLLVRRRRAR
jgi:MYXO-CTERM domain-containing protein